jgi:hypothetical protein
MSVNITSKSVLATNTVERGLAREPQFINNEFESSASCVGVPSVEELVLLGY